MILIFCFTICTCWSNLLTCTCTNLGLVDGPGDRGLGGPLDGHREVDGVASADDEVLEGGEVDPGLDEARLGRDGVGGVAGDTLAGVVDGDDSELVLGTFGQTSHRANRLGARAFGRDFPDAELGLLLDDPLLDLAAAVRLWDHLHMKSTVGGERGLPTTQKQIRIQGGSCPGTKNDHMEDN